MSESEPKKPVEGRRPKGSVKDAGYGTFNVRVPMEFRGACVEGAAVARKSLGRWLGELARKEASRG